MSPFMTWFADNLGTILVGGLLVTSAALVFAAVASWRAARRRQTRPRALVGLIGWPLVLLVSAGGVVLSSAGLVNLGPGVWAQHQMLGKTAPEFEFSLVESAEPGRLADFGGSVVLLNVWATWCPPCRAEMADLDALQESYAGAGLVVLHVSDEDRETLLAWLEDHPAATVHAYAQPIPWPETGRPTTYLIDRDRILRRVMLGQRSYDQFASEVEPYL